jgi:putative phosphoesterase
MTIGLLSDTHDYFDDRLRQFFDKVDELWHAGDIGSLATVEAIAAFKPLRAVYGNYDGKDIRSACPRQQRFVAGGVEVLMTHIGGYPGRYEPDVARLLQTHPPQLFIAGHSHILKVMYDKRHRLLYMNPGAAGLYGIHLVRTAVRFVVDSGSIKDLEVGEWAKRKP